MPNLSLPYKNKLFLNRYICYKSFFFYIQYNPYKSFQKKKFIIIISKKSGNAVIRNYIRRITKGIIKIHTSLFHSDYTHFISFNKISLQSITYKKLDNEFSKIKKLYYKNI